MDTNTKRLVATRTVVNILSSSDNKYPTTRALNIASIGNSLRIWLRAESDYEFIVFDHTVNLASKAYCTEVDALASRLLWFTEHTREERVRTLADYWYVRHATHKRDVYENRLVCDDCKEELLRIRDGFTSVDKHHTGLRFSPTVSVVREPSHPLIKWGVPVVYDTEAWYTHTQDGESVYVTWVAYLGHDPEVIFLTDAEKLDDMSFNMDDIITAYFINGNAARESVVEAEREWWARRKSEKDSEADSFSRAWKKAVSKTG